jgi:hypothetical protein
LYQRDLVLKENLEKVESIDLRYQRAKKVASHIEKQMKDLKPNCKIDYQMFDDYEPSTQLLASILAKDIVPANMIKGTYSNPG